MAIHENIARLRSAAGISARELSKKAGLAWGHIALIERQVASNPTQKTLEAIADALGVTVDDLLSDKASHSPKTDKRSA